MTKRETCKWGSNHRPSALCDSRISTCVFPLPAWMTRESPRWPTVWDLDCDRCPCWTAKNEAALLAVEGV